MERREGPLTGKYFVNIKDNQFLVFIIPNVNVMESIHNCYAPPWRGGGVYMHLNSYICYV